MCFPWSRRAAAVAIRPSTRSSASMTCQCPPSPTWRAVPMNVDIPETDLSSFRARNRLRAARNPMWGIPRLARTVGRVQATVNPNDTSVSGDCQGRGRVRPMMPMNRAGRTAQTREPRVGRCGPSQRTFAEPRRPNRSASRFPALGAQPARLGQDCVWSWQEQSDRRPRHRVERGEGGRAEGRGEGLPGDGVRQSNRSRPTASSTAPSSTAAAVADAIRRVFENKAFKSKGVAASLSGQRRHRQEDHASR